MLGYSEVWVFYIKEKKTYVQSSSMGEIKGRFIKEKKKEEGIIVCSGLSAWLDTGLDRRVILARDVKNGSS